MRNGGGSETMVANALVQSMERPTDQ
jgi:hypothetical protein